MASRDAFRVETGSCDPESGFKVRRNGAWCQADFPEKCGRACRVAPMADSASLWSAGKRQRVGLFKSLSNLGLHPFGWPDTWR